ncbi:MAG: alanine/ornithine racemase family PLP-dependent enzyme [Bacillota bacterium]
MSANPRLDIDLAKLQHNAHTVVELARLRGVSVTGVVKGCCGDPRVGRAMLDGGVAALGDSRVANLARLRAGLPGCELWLLRLPMPSEVAKVVRLADLVLISEPATARLLGQEATRTGRAVKVLLMVDVGDLREGVWPDRVVEVAMAMARIPGLDLVGLGTNLACYGGVVPDPQNMGTLLSATRAVETALGRTLQVISGGNSANLNLFLDGRLPRGITNVRIGEGILMGREAVARQPVPGTYQDAFTLVAEVIEEAMKPSVPLGCIGQDAFGRVPSFEDRGIRRRAILAAGRQDLAADGIFPREEGVFVLGASSDHLLVDVTESRRSWAPGGEMAFDINYTTLLQAMTSPYVTKCYVG